MQKVHDELERRVEERTDELVRSNQRLRQEIAERKRVEEALRQSQERYRQLVEDANDIIYGADDGGHFAFVNPVAARILRYPEEELMGKHYLDLIRPDHRQDVERFYASQFVEKIQNTYYEIPVVAGDGTKLWLGQNVQLVMENDQVAGFQAVARDITMHKALEEMWLRTTGWPSGPQRGRRW